MDLSLEERERRARAAIGYARLPMKAVAVHFRVSEATRGRWLKTLTQQRLYDIVDLCEVPRRFADEGFALTEDTPAGWRTQVERRLTAVERIESRLARLEADLSPLLGGPDVPPLPAALVQRIREALPTVEVHGQQPNGRDVKQLPPAQVDQPGA